MVRFNSAGRVQPVEGMYLIHPGTCMLCGKVPDNGQEYFASLGIELEYYGMVYLCQACCNEIADFSGFVPTDTLNAVLRTNEILTNKNIEVQKSLAAAKEMLNARIDAAGRSEYNLHEPAGISVSEVKSDADFIDSILNGEQPESS